MKKITRYFPFFVIALFFSEKTFAQNTSQKGTYQLVYTSRNIESEKAINLTDVQLAKLESLRDETKAIYVRISDSDDAPVVKLLSKQLINSANFSPVPEKIYLVEERMEAGDYQDYRNSKKIDLNSSEKTVDKK